MAYKNIFIKEVVVDGQIQVGIYAWEGYSNRKCKFSIIENDKVVADLTLESGDIDDLVKILGEAKDVLEKRS